MTGSGAGWEPVVEETDDVITPAVAAALHGLLDAPGAPPTAGDPVPPLWHWLAFLPRTAQRELGVDGHPRPGAFMPPVEGRRMFAGGRLRFADGLRVGEGLRRRSLVTAVEQKEGRSGRLHFVTVTHEVQPAGGGPAAVTDIQDIVYRPAPPPPGPAGGTTPTPTAPSQGGDGSRTEGWEWGFDLQPDPTLLFRFSALTYNAHRIHYDRTYATEEEGYPGLVVHGPLQAIAAAELCRRHVPERPLKSFRFRAVRPAFDSRPLAVRGRRVGDDDVDLAVIDHTGSATMQAEATLST